MRLVQPAVPADPLGGLFPGLGPRVIGHDIGITEHTGHIVKVIAGQLPNSQPVGVWTHTSDGSPRTQSGQDGLVVARRAWGRLAWGGPGRSRCQQRSILVASADGHFQAAVQAAPGTTVITTTATRGAHATGWAQLTVTS